MRLGKSSLVLGLILSGAVVLHAAGVAYSEDPMSQSDAPRKLVDDDSERPNWRKGFDRRGGPQRQEREMKRQEMREKFGMLKGRERFLKFSKEYYEAVRDPHAAIGFAVLGIKERHRRAGAPAGAIPELEALLQGVKDQGARNIVLFTIRQIHEAAKDDKQYAAVNDQILKENLAAVHAKPSE